MKEKFCKKKLVANLKFIDEKEAIHELSIFNDQLDAYYAIDSCNVGESTVKKTLISDDNVLQLEVRKDIIISISKKSEQEE